MDQSEDPKEIERKIEQAVRIASSVSDQTTIQRRHGRSLVFVLHKLSIRPLSKVSLRNEPHEVLLSHG